MITNPNKLRINTSPVKLRVFDVIRYEFRTTTVQEAVVIQTEKGLNVCHIIEQEGSEPRLGFAGTVQPSDVISIIGSWNQSKVEEGLMRTFGENEEMRLSVRRHLGEAALQRPITIDIAHTD